MNDTVDKLDLVETDSRGLWKHQQIGVDWLAANERRILGDDKGLGKTAQLLVACRELDVRGLIVCPGSAVYVWRDEIQRWDPHADILIMDMGPYLRPDVWRATEQPNPGQWVIVTYAVMQRDILMMPKYWDVVIFDEAHKLRNHKVHTSKKAKVVRFTAFGAGKKLHGRKAMFFATGSPSRRGAQDMWTMFHMLQPQLFRSYWKFVKTFCIVEDGLWGGKEIIGPKNVHGFERIRDRFMLRRLKGQIEGLPPKIRQTLPVKMYPEDRKFYDQLAKDCIAFLEDSGNVVASPSQAVNIMKLRQFLVCPSLIDPDVVKFIEKPKEFEGQKIKIRHGAAIELIVEHAGDLDEPHFAVCTPFARVIPILKALFESLDWPVNVIQGGMPPKKRKEQEAACMVNRGVLIYTAKVAESFSVPTISTGYMLGYEWDPDVQEQAEDRIHRATSKGTVNWYYIKHEDTVDERVEEVLFDKSYDVYRILGDPKFLIEAIKPS